MIENAVVKNAKIAFVMGFRMGENFEKVWDEARENCTAGYWWKTDDNGTPHPVEAGEQQSELLDDFQTVEDFYLNARSSLMIGEDRLKIERCVPDFPVRIQHIVDGRELLNTTAEVVLTYYRTVDVLTVTLNFQLGSINADDLIYVKSLKWDSRDGLRGSRTVEVSYENPETDEPTWEEVNFDTLFEQVRDRFFPVDSSMLAQLGKRFPPSSVADRSPGQSGVATYELKTSGDVILDAISIRGLECEEQNSSELHFEGAEPPEPTKQSWAEDAVLYGLVTGDEGYDLNTCKTIEEVVSARDSKLDTRWYFDYFFSGTSVVADLSEEYDSEKQDFKREYVKRYGSYPPYDEYLDLYTRVATLEDGMFLFGEIALVRYVLLMYVDEQLEETLSIEEDNSILPRGRDLRDLEKVKWNATTQLTRIDMLTESVLGLSAVPSFNKMFEYATTKRQVRERLGDLDDSIHYRYNRRIQRALVVLALLTILLTFLVNFGKLETIVFGAFEQYI